MIKNLGQVAAIHISNQAPVNKKIVWVDTNENPYVFKLYDVNKWVPIATQEWTANFINGWVITLKPADEASADDYLLLNKGGENHKITVDAFVRSAIGNPLDFKGVIRKDSDFPSPETVQGGDMYVVITGNPDVTVTDPNTGQTFSDTEKIVWDTVTKNWASLGKIEIEVNLGTKYTDTAVEVTSSAGESAIINPATDSTAGIMSALLYKYLTALSNGTTIPGVTTGETPGHKHNYDDIVNRLVSQQAEGDSTRNPMSQDAVTKALFKKFDKASVVQITGAGQDVVMSQDITTKELNKRLLLSGGTMTGSIKSTIGNILLNNNGEALIYQESANKINYFGSALENTFFRSKGDVGLIKGSNQYKLWDSENLPDPVKQFDSIKFTLGSNYVGATFYDTDKQQRAVDYDIEWGQTGEYYNFKIGNLTTVGSINSAKLITATNGVQIGSVSDVGWFNNSNRICAGMSSAKGINVGSLLISDKWADASKVPTNGIYAKGTIISNNKFETIGSITNGNRGYCMSNNSGDTYCGLGNEYNSGYLILYNGIKPRVGSSGYVWSTIKDSVKNGSVLALPENGDLTLKVASWSGTKPAEGSTATTTSYKVWTAKDFTNPKFAYGFEAIATGTSSIDLNTIFSETNGGYVYNYSGASKWVNAPSGMSYGGVYQLGYSGVLNGLYLQLAGDIKHAENNSKTGRLWYRMPGNGGLATAGWKRLLTEEDDLANILTKEKADTYYYPINGKGNLSFTGNGNPLLENNQGYCFKDIDGHIVEAIWLSDSNNLVIGQSSNAAGTLNNILIRGNLKTETGLNDYLYNYYASPKFLTNLSLYVSKTGITGSWARSMIIAEQPEATTRASWGAFGGETVTYSYFGVFTGNEDYDKVNTLKLYTDNATFGNKSLAVWGAESNALTKLLYNRTLTINGTGWSVVGTAPGNMSTIYAPTTVGTAGQILQSNGSGAPVWADVTGLAIQNALKTTDKKTYADPVASYVTSKGDLQGIRIKLPFKDTSNKMVQFSIRFNGDYSFVDLVVFFYLSSSNGGYVYGPAVRMADGTTSVPVKIGSADDGTVYVWVGGLINYYGVLVHDVTAAFNSGDWSTGWEITTGDASVITDVRYDRTVDPPLTSVSIATISDLHSTWDAFMKAGLYTRTLGVNGKAWQFLSNVNGATTSVYAPTTAGTNGQFLKSTGGVPSWVDLTPALIGAATASHTHTLSQISDLDSSWDAVLKAAPSYLPLSGGTMNNGAKIIFGVGESTDGGGISQVNGNVYLWFPTSTSAVFGNSTATEVILRTNAKSNLYHQVGVGTKYKIYDSNNFGGLTIQLNGTSQGVFNGSVAKTINITASSIGAAAASHTHTLSQISDLNSSWDAILKASATSATFTPKAHNQASNTITAMTGYVKGSNQAAISTSDSLNMAIAKLEVKADSKLTTTSSSAGQATNMIVVTELPSSPAANTLYLIVEA